MLDPDAIEDRQIRHLPMEWWVSTAFTAGTDGRAADVRATPTSPQSFSNHMVVAVKSWRFAPATREGNAVASRCTILFGCHLHQGRRARLGAPRTAACTTAASPAPAR